MIVRDSSEQYSPIITSTDPIPESYQRIRSQVEDRLLERIMIDYLVSATPSHLPGGEGMRTNDILHEYKDLSVSGIVPVRSVLLLRHSELTAAIERFFPEDAN